MKDATLLKRMGAVVKELPSSGYRMGDLFTLTVGEHVVKHDTREYYSGSKYNRSIRHGNITVTMTVTELNRSFKPIAARIAAYKQHAKEWRRSLKR